jgi:RNA polymerase sigma factor (sigma-70 family)
MVEDAVLTAAGCVRFAREQLGPASERFLSSPEAQALALSRIRGGATLQDAVLWLVHREARSSAAVANEFTAYFLSDLLAVSRPAIAPGLRRYLDSGDLVQSVLGDVWRDLASIEFDTRAAFLAFLAQRLRWKAADQHRSLRRNRRSEDRRADESPEDLALPGRERDPASVAAQAEDREHLALRILRLPERDRELVRMHLRGDAVAVIAASLDLSEEAARKAVQRALVRLREMR